MSRAWRIREKRHHSEFLTLLDARSWASTAPLELSDGDTAPDLVVLCFEKIFGCPTQLGALLIRKNSPLPRNSQLRWEGKVGTNVGKTFQARTNLICLELESVLDIGHAINIHRELYGFGSMEAIFRRTMSLAQMLLNKLQELVHASGNPVVRIYKSDSPGCWSSSTHGPVIAINVMRADGSFIDSCSVAEAAVTHNIRVSSRDLCNSRSLATNHQWDIGKVEPSRWLHVNQAARLPEGPTCVVRLSLGATNTEVDVLDFTDFIERSYIDRRGPAVEALLRKVEAWRTSIVDHTNAPW